jgi:hypothetical protein
MSRATITRIDSRSNPSNRGAEDYNTSPQDSSGWAKLWKAVFLLYLPATVVLEAFLIILMSSWPTNNTSESDYIHSVANGWVIILFFQILIPILSFFIRFLIGFFMTRRFDINLLNRISRNAGIPVMAAAILLFFFLSSLFAYMTKNFNLFTMITTGFLFVSFYFSGIITTLSWVTFVLERNNPYEATA